jgi:apolipoprotein N-acyltransferase
MVRQQMLISPRNGLVFALILAATLGLFGTLAHGIWPAWWLSLASQTGLVALLFHYRAREHAVRNIGFITLSWSLTYFSVGVGWLYISMHRYGGLPMLLAAGGVLAMALLLSSFGTISAMAAQRWSKTQGGFALIFSSGWALAEWTRGWIFTGFPWLASGYAQLDGPLQALAPWIGVFGISLVLCLFASAGALTCSYLRHANWRAFGLTLALTAFLVAALALAAHFGRHFTQSVPGTISVRLVQGNVPQEMKFDPLKARAAMRRYINAIAQSRAQLTVLPETAWVVPWEQTPRDLADDLKQALRMSSTTLALGIPALDAGQFYNSVDIIDATGQAIARYNKQHLVPFGEFIPPGFRWFVDMMHIPLGDFGRGRPDQPLLRLQGQFLGFNICYEDLFGEALAEQVRQGAGVLVNVSNIAWFGDSHALPQHLMIARMRSMELGRPMLRATNTGVTAYIDAQGQVIAQLKHNIESVLDVQVAARSGLTPFARWGHAVMLILSASIVALGLALRPR